MNINLVKRLIASSLLSATIIGCGGVSETGRDNRRLFDAILTAVVLKNPKELSKDKTLLEERHESGKISKTSFAAINTRITSAEGGNWKSAEEGLYAFRKKTPFPN